MEPPFHSHWFIQHCLSLGRQESYAAADVELATEAVDKRLDEISREREELKYILPRIVSKDKEVRDGSAHQRNIDPNSA